jgi:hypothetical protein
MVSPVVDETPEKSFRYVDLPFDIRYKVLNEHVLKATYGTMLPKGFEVYYKAFPVPTALLQTNKAMYDEVQTERATLTKEKAVSLICALNNILYAARILEMVGQGLERYIQHYQRDPSAKPFELPKMLTLMPARVLKSRVSQLRNTGPVHSEPLRANEINDAPLIEFLTSAILCSRPNQLICIRAVVGAPLGSSSLGGGLALRSGVDLFTCIGDMAKVVNKMPGKPTVQLTVVSCADDDAKLLSGLGSLSFGGCISMAVEPMTEHDQKIFVYQQE